jgi:hypothetical protein
MQQPPAATTTAPPVEEILLGNRELLNLQHARIFLATRARVRTPLGATEFLTQTDMHGRETYDKRVRLALDCCGLYRDFFPDEYARSAAPPFSTRREHEFYRHVNRDLFPLVLNGGVELETEIRREPQFFLPFIPVRGVQRHVWAGGCFDFQEIETGFQVAQVLSWMTGAGGRGWHALSLLYGLGDCPPPLAPSYGGVAWTLFVYSCSVEETPMKYLPLAFHMISYRTENMWLDLPQIGACGFEWSHEEVSKLARLWKGAEEINRRLAVFNAWLDEDPKPRIARAVELWNMSLQAEQATGFGGVRTEYGQFFRATLDGAALRQIYGDRIPLNPDMNAQMALIAHAGQADMPALLGE